MVGHCHRCHRLDEVDELPRLIRYAVALCFAAVHLGAVVEETTRGALCRDCLQHACRVTLPLGLLLAGGLTAALVLLVRQLPLP